MPQTDAALLYDLQNAFPEIADLSTELTKEQWQHIKTDAGWQRIKTVDEDSDRRWAEMFPDTDGPDELYEDAEFEIARSRLPHWLKLIRLEEFRAESRSSTTVHRHQSGLTLVGKADRTVRRCVTIPFPPRRETGHGPCEPDEKVSA